MDPVSLIVAALIAGASAGAKETAGAAVKDAYAGLKRLVRRHFGDDDSASELERPGSNRPVLEERLRAAHADADEELVRAAQNVMRELDPDGARAGKYNVTIAGGKGIVVGEHATVTMNFDGE